MEYNTAMRKYARIYGLKSIYYNVAKQQIGQIKFQTHI